MPKKTLAQKLIRVLKAPSRAKKSRQYVRGQYRKLAGHYVRYGTLEGRAYGWYKKKARKNYGKLKKTARRVVSKAGQYRLVREVPTSRRRSKYVRGRFHTGTVYAKRRK